jgi:hypothetical protein
VIAGLVLGVAGCHILAGVVRTAVLEVLLHTCSAVADCMYSGGDMVAAVDPTAVAGLAGKMGDVVKVQVCMVMHRRPDLTVEENYTCWRQDVTDRVVVAMTSDRVLAKDFGPPARAGRIHS